MTDTPGGAAVPPCDACAAAAGTVRLCKDCWHECAAAHVNQGLQRAPEALTAEALDDGYVALLREARARVEASVLYARFISGTPLENDIAVWMADFALATVKAVSAQMLAAALARRAAPHQETEK